MAFFNLTNTITQKYQTNWLVFAYQTSWYVSFLGESVQTGKKMFHHFVYRKKSKFQERKWHSPLFVYHFWKCLLFEIFCGLPSNYEYNFCKSIRVFGFRLLCLELLRLPFCFSKPKWLKIPLYDTNVRGSAELKKVFCVQYEWKNKS